MSRHKAFLPSTYVPGYKVHRDKQGAVLLHTDPSRPELLGKPMITLAAPIGHGLHFKNHAARLRVAARIGCKPTDDAALIAGLKEHSTPKDLVKVPVYRGFPCAFANHVRASHRREERIKEEKSLLERGIQAIKDVVQGASSPAAEIAA